MFKLFYFNPLRECTYVLSGDRGECVMRCHIDPGFRPGVVKTEHGWLGEQYIKGSQNELTSDAVRHMYPSAEHFDTLCEVEKYTA